MGLASLRSGSIRLSLLERPPYQPLELAPEGAAPNATPRFPSVFDPPRLLAPVLVVCFVYPLPSHGALTSLAALLLLEIARLFLVVAPCQAREFTRG